MGVSNSSDHIQIRIKMSNCSQEPSAASEAPNQDLKHMNDFCTFKIKIDSQNWEYGCNKEKYPYSKYDPYFKPQSGTSSILQCPKSGLKCHECSLHLPNKDRETKLRIWVNQKPVTISKSISRCKIPVRNISVL